MRTRITPTEFGQVVLGAFVRDEPLVRIVIPPKSAFSFSVNEDTSGSFMAWLEGDTQKALELQAKHGPNRDWNAACRAARTPVVTLLVVPKGPLSQFQEWLLQVEYTGQATGGAQEVCVLTDQDAVRIVGEELPPQATWILGGRRIVKMDPEGQVYSEDPEEVRSLVELFDALRAGATPLAQYLEKLRP